MRCIRCLRAQLRLLSYKKSGENSFPLGMFTAKGINSIIEESS